MTGRRSRWCGPVMRRRLVAGVALLGLLVAAGLVAASPSPAATGGDTVAAFGYNAFGQLGDGTTTDRSTPTAVSGLAGVSSVAAGGGQQTSHSLAVTDDGAVYAWGSNRYGQLGDGSTDFDRGSHSSVPVRTELEGTYTTVAAGAWHSLALKSDGTVWTWGADPCNGSGSGAPGATPVQVKFPASAGKIAAIAAGSNGNSSTTQAFSLAVAEDGEVYAWGDNTYGQLGRGTAGGNCELPAPVTWPAGAVKIRAVAAGLTHSLALGVDGTVYAWGENLSGQLGQPPGGVASVPLAVSGLSGVSAIAAGHRHSLALSAGKVYAWGSNQYGQLGYATLGSGSATHSSTPTKVKKNDGTDLDGVKQVAGGVAHTLALDSNATVWAWGAVGNDKGQTGSTASRPASQTPAQVSEFEGPVASIAAAGSHSLAVLGAGTSTGPPSNSKRPSFTGQAKEGQTLRGDRGEWSGGDLSFSYRWKRCDTNGSACRDIAGATAVDYTLRSTEVGTRVKLVVTASNPRGTVTAESDLSEVVAAAGDTPPPCQDSSAASVSGSTSSSASSSSSASATGGADSSGASAAAAPSEGQDNPWVEQRSVFSPTAHLLHVMANYPMDPRDLTDDRVVLFGGESGGPAGQPVAETWVWDGATATWKNATPPPAAPGQPATSPPARIGAVMAYSPGPDGEDAGQLVLFGGANGDGEVFDDTWTWDGSKWTQQHPEHTPPARWGAVMAENPGSGLVLFGGGQTPPNGSGTSPGRQGEQMLCDTWTWAGSDWQERDPATSPPARRLATMAYHQDTDQAVLFGGTWPTPRGNGYDDLLRDTWTWDGSKWSKRSPPQVPRARFGAQMASLPAVGTVVLYDGSPPNPRGDVIGTNCPPDQIVFCSPGDTWTWDGTAWTRRFPADDPGHRAFGSMAYDAPRERVVMFGGLGSFTNETWTWDGKRSTDSVDTRLRVTLTVDPSSIPADGQSTSTATVRMTIGHQGKSGGHVSFSSSGDVTFGEVKDNGDGTYTATITASETAGEEQITARGYFAPTVGPNGTASARLTETVSGSANGCPPQPEPPSGPSKWTDLDESFACHGKATTGGPYGRSGGMVLQPDGKIVVSGASLSGGSLVRYLPDGSLDRGFGTGGVVRLADDGLGLALHDGKIVVSSRDSLARYNADGTADTSFGQGGRTPAKYVESIAIQGLGRAAKIVGAGDNYGTIVRVGDGGFGVSRYNADGSPDTSFGTKGDGTIDSDFGVRSSKTGEVVIQRDGKIVVGGRSTIPFSKSEYTVARYLPARGALDPSFNPCSQSPPPCDGIATADSGAAGVSGTPTRLTIQGDDKILLAGGTSGGGFFLARFNVGTPNQPDGTLDTTFNACGQVSQRPCGGMIAAPSDVPGGRVSGGSYPYAVAVQPADGRIVVAGYGPYTPADFNSEQGDFLVARYNPDGTLESCGSPYGVRTRVGYDAGAQGVAIQPDGKIVAAGFYSAGARTGKGTAVVRYRGGPGPGPCRGLSVNDAAPVSEPESEEAEAKFTVTLNQPPDATVGTGVSGGGVSVYTPPVPVSTPVRVEYATADGSATAGEDYEATSGTLVFEPGETQKSVEVPVLADDVREGAETFEVRLSGAVNASVARGRGVGTILDGPGGSSYACLAASEVGASAATLGAATDDGSVRSARFTLRRGDDVVARRRVSGSSRFAVRVAGLAPGASYSYTVSFEPGAHASQSPACGFDTLRASAGPGGDVLGDQAGTPVAPAGSPARAESAGPGSPSRPGVSPPPGSPPGPGSPAGPGLPASPGGSLRVGSPLPPGVGPPPPSLVSPGQAAGQGQAQPAGQSQAQAAGQAQTAAAQAQAAAGQAQAMGQSQSQSQAQGQGQGQVQAGMGLERERERQLQFASEQQSGAAGKGEAHQASGLRGVPAPAVGWAAAVAALMAGFLAALGSGGGSPATVRAVARRRPRPGQARRRRRRR